jgi:glycosyltransferase involved in cell wall biosynthesis
VNTQSRQSPDGPKITTIIATYNSANTIGSAVKSFLAQDWPNKELIVVDASSSDGTQNIVSRFDSQLVTLVSEPDRGVYDAWNKGIRLSQGEWIHFLGSDDAFFDQSVLTKVGMQLNRIPNFISVFATGVRIYRSNFELFDRPHCLRTIKKNLLQSSTLSTIPHPGCYHRRSSFSSLGAFNESFKIAGDYDLLARWIKVSEFAIDPEIISVSMEATGMSANLRNSYKIANELILSRKINQLNLSAEFIWTLVRFASRGSLARLLGESRARRLIDNLKRF